MAQVVREAEEQRAADKSSCDLETSILPQLSFAAVDILKEGKTLPYYSSYRSVRVSLSATCIASKHHMVENLCEARKLHVSSPGNPQSFKHGFVFQSAE